MYSYFDEVQEIEDLESSLSPSQPSRVSQPSSHSSSLEVFQSVSVGTGDDDDGDDRNKVANSFLETEDCSQDRFADNFLEVDELFSMQIPTYEVSFPSKTNAESHETKKPKTSRAKSKKTSKSKANQKILSVSAQNSQENSLDAKSGEEKGAEGGEIEPAQTEKQAESPETSEEEETGKKFPWFYIFCLLAICVTPVLIFLPQDIFHLDWYDNSKQQERNQKPDDSSSLPTDRAAFPGVMGPSEITDIPKTSTPTQFSRYGSGSSSSLAIALNGNNTIHWPVLVHSLKAIGIPIKVYTDIESALSHRVVLIYPEITGVNTEETAFQRVIDHVKKGNTVIAFGINRAGLFETFGFENVVHRSDLQSLTLHLQDGDSFPESSAPEVEILYDEKEASGMAYWGLAHSPLATFGNDGGAAIVWNQVQNGDRVGRGYAIGFDYCLFAARTRNGRMTQDEEMKINKYFPTLDDLSRLIAKIYREGEPNAIQIMTSPFAKEFTTLITHDIDCGYCMENVRDFLEVEWLLGVNATYFVQTKYVEDWNDKAFFNESQRPLIESIVASGMEVASHTVAHSGQFQYLQSGSGREMYPSYRPYVRNHMSTRDATIAGELRVSKFLLELLSGHPVRSFRPGPLRFPVSLPQLLEATGYAFSSSITANHALTHYPYRAMFQSHHQAETSVFEFPVTFDVGNGLPLDSRVSEAIHLANKISRDGGLVNILIHTDTATHKLDFVRDFVREFGNRTWFPTMQAYGDWWRLRDDLVIDIVEGSYSNGTSTRTLVMDSRHGELVGLTLRVPPTWFLQDGQVGVSQTNNVVVVDRLSRNSIVAFDVPSEEAEP